MKSGTTSAWRTLRAIVLPVLLLASGTESVAVWAGINRWTNHGLAAEIVRALVIDPKNSSILYAGTARGIFKSTDRGQNWRPINSGLTAITIAALAIDPQNPSAIYAGIGAIVGTGAQIFKTTDGGNSWSEASFGLPPVPPGRGSWRHVSVIAIDPQTPRTVYAGITTPHDAPALFRSTDGGATWNAAHSGLSVDSGGVDTLAIDPQDFTTIYAAGAFGVFKSTDRGSSWSPANSGLPPCNGTYNVFLCHTSLAIDPQNPRTLYAGIYGVGVFKSTDGGTSWSAANTGPVSVGPLAIDPQDPKTLYAGTANYCGCQDDPSTTGVWKTANGGTSWSQVNSQLPVFLGGPYPDINFLAIDLQNPHTLYAATYPGGFYAITFASEFSPILTLDTASYCIDSSWTLTVSNAFSNAPVRLQGATNDQSWEILAWQTTGSDGSVRVQGNFPPGTEGRYTLNVEVGRQFSNTISFAVSSCRP